MEGKIMQPTFLHFSSKVQLTDLDNAYAAIYNQFHFHFDLGSAA